MPAVSPFPYPVEMSWDEKQEQARIARERKRYEASINEVTSELESMRTKVAELLEENNALPEAERMDGKVNSVQEACAKCFAVHILEFEILQTT